MNVSGSSLEVFQGCFMSVSLVFHECFMDVSPVFHVFLGLGNNLHTWQFRTNWQTQMKTKALIGKTGDIAQHSISSYDVVRIVELPIFLPPPV